MSNERWLHMRGRSLLTARQVFVVAVSIREVKIHDEVHDDFWAGKGLERQRRLRRKKQLKKKLGQDDDDDDTEHKLFDRNGVF